LPERPDRGRAAVTAGFFEDEKAWIGRRRGSNGLESQLNDFYLADRVVWVGLPNNLSYYVVISNFL